MIIGPLTVANLVPIVWTLFVIMACCPILLATCCLAPVRLHGMLTRASSLQVVSPLFAFMACWPGPARYKLSLPCSPSWHVDQGQLATSCRSPVRLHGMLTRASSLQVVAPLFAFMACWPGPARYKLSLPCSPSWHVDQGQPATSCRDK